MTLRSVRRKSPALLAFAIVAAFAAMVTVQTASAANTELRFAHVNSPGDPCHDGTQVFADLVKKLTDGRLTLKIFPKAQLGNQRELFAQLRSGAVDATCTNYPILSDVVPEFLTLNGGFFYDDWEQVRAVLDSPDLGQAWQKQLVEKGGVRVLGSFYYGARNVTLNKSANSRGDLVGLKLRAVPNPISLAIVRGLGPSPTPVAFPELFQALRQGVVDGQENPIPVIHAHKFYEVQKFLIRTRHQINAMPFVINEKAFQKVPAADRRILVKAAELAAEWATNHTIVRTESLVSDLESKGMTMIQPTAAALAEWKKAVRAEIATNVDGKIWPKGMMQKIISLNE
jgi:TRAP-type transport system periplasmic protein